MSTAPTIPRPSLSPLALAGGLGLAALATGAACGSGSAEPNGEPVTGGAAHSAAPTEAVQRPTPPANTGPVAYGFEIVAKYPHDPAAFSQGLVFDAGRLFESTGQYGSSSLREVALETGEVVRNLPVSPLYFAEGLEVIGDRLYQLTWKRRTGLIYDKQTFEQVGTFSYDGEGWGLTYDGTSLIVSDGSPVLRFIDPESFEVTRRVSVRRSGRQVRDLNELEWVEDEIWANVWKSDEILRIDPETGAVTGVIDLGALNTYSPILEFDLSAKNVLNGIAYDPANGRLFVTGKLWPDLYEITVAPLE